jgi:hypothetical protein
MGLCLRATADHLVPAPGGILASARLSASTSFAADLGVCSDPKNRVVLDYLRRQSLRVFYCAPAPLPFSVWPYPDAEVGSGCVCWVSPCRDTLAGFGSTVAGGVGNCLSGIGRSSAEVFSSQQCGFFVLLQDLRARPWEFSTHFIHI